MKKIKGSSVIEIVVSLALISIGLVLISKVWMKVSKSAQDSNKLIEKFENFQKNIEIEKMDTLRVIKDETTF